MGGYGSGRRAGAPLADTALIIDINWLVRTGRAVMGAKVTGSINWHCDGQPSGNIGYSSDMRDADNARLELRYTVNNRYQGTGQDHVQHIRLSYSVPHYGGKKWFMHCPANGKRVSKLYCPAGAHKFASRTAWGLGYQSQREAKHDRPLTRLRKLQKRIDANMGWADPIKRPKGMWQRTYDRLAQRCYDLESQCDAQMDKWAAQLQG